VAQPNPPVHAALLDLIESRPRFWYSRVSLLHALGIRLACSGTNTPDGLSARGHAALRHAAADPHPLVREAARLIQRGIWAGQPPESFSWLAETDVARSNSRLGEAAQRLLGDTSLFLNLIYCAEPWSEPSWRLIAESDELPECIRRPAVRESLMRDGCPPGCRFQLCPYPGPARRGRGRGELSGAFCRVQRDLSGRLPRAAWQEKHARHELVGFWLYAEEHLATREGWEINL
jgi:hypothetical protein